MMDLQLKDSTVLVTGSSAGVGQATAIAFGA
jgi:NADP-dependent 3-hydroxy acid dehydrogenase YdfG